MNCDKPDRDFPKSKLKCGYPLPCPYHTAVVFTEEKIIFREPIHGEKRREVIEVGMALQKLMK